MNGVDLNPLQDTPVASRKEDTYIHFNTDVEIQRHVEKLPKGNVPVMFMSNKKTKQKRFYFECTEQEDQMNAIKKILGSIKS